MSIRLSTAGVQLGYAVEATKGTKPTTGFTMISELKEIPSINAEPSLLETTTLDEKEYRTYIPGLKDLGSALTFTANLTQDFKTQWEAMVTASEEAKTNGKATWYVIIIPGITEACYLQGEPSALGFSGASVDSVLEAEVYITPTSAPTWGTAPSK